MIGKRMGFRRHHSWSARLGRCFEVEMAKRGRQKVSFEDIHESSQIVGGSSQDRIDSGE